MYKVKFKVGGKVQGVSFRKYTKIEADKLNIKGYVENKPDGTVVGVGHADDQVALESFKRFLQTKGSPNSVIESCEFNPDDEGKTYESFDILY